MADRVVRAILRAEVTQFVGAMRQAEKSTKDFSKNATDSATKHKESWDKVGKGMMVTGGVMAAGVGIAIKSFADFDSAMSQAKAGTMATGKTFDALRAAAIDAGAKTQFSATEAANAITELGKAGVSTKDILAGGLTGALSLAAAGQLEVGQAAEIAATAMNQFGLEGKDIPHIADLLAAGAGKAMGSVEDLSMALKYAGVVAAGAGWSIEETTGVLAEFAQAGIKGEQAGTSLRGIISALTAPSEKAAGVMEDLGLKMYDNNGHMLKAAPLAGALQKAVGSLSEADRNQALGQIFGNEQLTAAQVLYKGGAAAVTKWTKEVNDQAFATRQAAMLTDNWNGDIERLGGSLSSVLIQSGSGANGMLRTMTKELQHVVDGYGALPAPVQQGVLALGAVTAAALLAGGAFVSFYPKIKATQAALGDMGRTGTIATRSLKGLAGAASIALVALPALEAVSGGISRSLGQLAPDADEAAKAIEALATKGKATGDSADLINRHWDDLGNTINNVFSPELGHKVNAFFSAISPGNLAGFETSETSQSIEFFKSLDSGLSQMVASGNGDKAAAMVKRVTDEAVKQGYAVKSVMGALPGYTAAQKAAGEADAVAAGKMTTATGAKLTGKAASDAMKVSEEALAQAAEDNKKAHDALVDSVTNYGSALLTARGDARSYEAAIDAATEALKANGRTLDIGTEKGRNNQAALDAIATSALKAAESTLTNAEANGTLSRATKTVGTNVGNARTQFIDMAKKMGMSETAAKALATQSGLTAGRVQGITNKLIDLGKQKPTPKADVDKRAADTKIKTLQGQIDAIKQNKVPGLNANSKTAKDKIAALQLQIDNLKGKTVPVVIQYSSNGVNLTAPSSVGRHATGGPIGGVGTGTSDSNLILASKGEHMLTADDVEAAGGHGAIYAWRKSLHGYAKGGSIIIDMPSSYAVNAGLSTGARNGATHFPAPSFDGIGAASGGGGGNANGLMAFARLINALGFQVGEHPAWGGVTYGAHVKNSRHYAGRAIDVNHDQGNEMGAIDGIIGLSRLYGLRHIWRAPNHWDHAHFDYDRGGMLLPGTTGQNTGRDPERVLTGRQTDSFERLVAVLSTPNQKLDSRINASRFGGGSTVATTVNLTVNPSAGMNEKQLAKAVIAEMNGAISGGLARVGVS